MIPFLLQRGGLGRIRGQGAGSVNPSLLALNLHFDGENGATTFFDSSSYGRTVTAFGGAQLSTANKKFGTASLSLNGTTGYAATTVLPAMPGDFTFDAWVYVTDSSVTRAVVTMGGIELYRRGSTNTLALYSGFNVVISGGTTFAINAWNHVAWSRKDGTHRIFLNGGVEGSHFQDSPLSTSSCFIGSYLGTTDYWRGEIDEAHVVIGEAIYTDSFTPPSSPLF